MDIYLNRLRNEQKKRVRFNIVEDNARLHSSREIVDRWAPIDRRLSLRRHHSQPILRKRHVKEDKATMRWNTESSTCAAPLKCPNRMLSSGGDRWRVSRNNSDSLIHTPPKRRFTSPLSPMLMMSSLSCKNLLSPKTPDERLPTSPPLMKTHKVIVDRALRELKGGVELSLDDSTRSETDNSSTDIPGEHDEFVPLVQTRKPRSPQQSQRQQQQQQGEESSPDSSNNLKSVFGLLNLMFFWSLWNTISEYISTIIPRYNKNENKHGLISKEEQNMVRMEQGEEAIPLSISGSPNSPTSPYSLSVPISLVAPTR